jgi:hypothetical protein
LPENPSFLAASSGPGSHCVCPIPSVFLLLRLGWETLIPALQQQSRCLDICPQTQRRPGRIAQAVAVNCWYWTKAIALKRVPRASSPLFPRPDPFVAIPGKPGSFGDELRRAIERFATPRIGPWATAYCEDAVASPAASLSAGATMGPKARCPRPQPPHVRNNSNNHLSSAGSTSFPVCA